jgi:hypothetical protein
MTRFMSLAFCLVVLGSFAANSEAATVDSCGQVTILSVLAGTRHGSMMQISNATCAPSGWVCLDPDAQYTTPEKSKRLYALVMMKYLSKEPVVLTVTNGVTASACGPYALVEDIRTQ